MLVQSGPLTAAITKIFLAAGCGREEAVCIAANLVESNLAGHDSHGVIRTKQYIDYVHAGTVKIGQDVEIAYETDAMAIVDGQMGFGQPIGVQAMELLASKTKKLGLGLVSIRGASHIGRIGAWAEQLAMHGLVSLHFVNTTGLGMLAMPFGGTDRRLSLCVFAAGVPMENGNHVILDFATTGTAEGKLRVARNKGVPVPEGQIVDKDGNPSTDANDFYNGGAILPLAGHKGHGLTMIVDLLSGALSGGGCTNPEVKVLENTMTSIAIDPNPMTDREAYVAEVLRYCEWVIGSPPKDQNSKVRLPGDIEREMRAERLESGISIDDETWQQIIETGESVGLSKADLEAAAGVS